MNQEVVKEGRGKKGKTIEEKRKAKYVKNE